MNSLRTPSVAFALLALLFSAVLPASALDDLLITELMAVNDSTLADEDGDFPDWVEIYNAGTNTVDLNGWYLTDNSGNLTKWRFPATNLAANAYLVVFASNKDRRVPGRPLHSNFQLNNSGEYLALVKPDGTTVQSAYTPFFPIQVSGVSFGLPVTANSVVLVSNGASGKFTVPVNGNLGSSWTLPGFNDTAWATVQNGVGFEREPAGPSSATVIANSDLDFSGNQGGGGWFYGYWDKEADANGTYEPADFVQFLRGTGNQLNSTNFFNGTVWMFPPPNNPPWTFLSRTGGHPTAENGNSSLPIHWAVRRYVSETNGPLRISGTIACQSSNGICGDGIVGRIFVDGVEVWSKRAFYESLGYSVNVDANLGSIIDFAIDPGDGNNDFCDSTTFTAVIRTAGDFVAVADTIADWSNTGEQGKGGWTYGFFIKTNAAVVYASNRFAAFPSGTGPHSSANFWNGEAWQWFEGDPPFDYVSETLSKPSIIPGGSTTNNQEHWVIRRWVSEISGPIQVDWHFSKRELTGLNTTAKIFHNGTQRDIITVVSNDFAGSAKTTSSFNVQVGDFIDITVEPGTDVVGDLSSLNATIFASTTVSNQFLSDVGSLMTNINSSAYLRLPFTVGSVQGLNSLKLRLKYDDGFVVYLNGSPIAAANNSDTNWNSVALSSRADALASQYEEFDLAEVATLIVPGNNVLAIQGINRSSTDADFLIAAELRAIYGTVNAGTTNYFALPTPGSINGAGSPNLGPLVTDIMHTPHDPADTDNLYVTARVIQTLHPISTVRLYYRVMFGSESNVVMLDDGLHADGVAGDGVYGAVIPHTISTYGEMVRYYITATATNNSLTRQPPFPHPTFSSQYFGAVVQNPALTNPLPVLHLFAPAATIAAAGNDPNGRFPCSLYWFGEFYDNVGFNRHGQSSSGFPKKSYDVDFNADHHFKWDPNEERVDDINLLTTYPDKGHIRNILAYEAIRDAGSPYHFTVPVRIQTNGGFYGDWHIVENGDADFLKRVGRDPNGALYKMYNTFTGIGNTTIGGDPNAEKKTRKHEGNADLVALFNGLVSPTALSNRVTYMYDNVNVAEVLNTLAARTVTSDWDCCHKNYYFYRDSDGTGEWDAMPWDIDLSFGRNWSSSESYWDDRVYPANRIWGNWDNNGFFQVVLNMPSGRGIDPTRQMYLRRVRTLMDELQQTNGTPAEQLHFEKRMDELAALIGPDAALDLPKWGTWGGGQTGIFATNSQYWRTMPQSHAETKTNYMPARRNYVFNQFMGLNGTDLINFTNRQPTNVVILIGAIDYNPSSGNQAEEYIELINTNNIAVDISGWTLTGAVVHTFQGGVVIPSIAPSNRVYVVPDKKAFRARTTGPRGGQRLYIEGPYKGQLSARGETIILADKTGRIVRTNTYIGSPSLPQQYLRITEIMYHPPNPPSGPYEAEDFEYIELKNIGPVSIDLTGVHFTNGVEFAFSGSAVTNLAPGQYALVVRNIAAFTARYGGGFNIAGQYVGILANEGENLRLDDAVGEKILDFDYNNAWYPITDGPGASLVIVNENAVWNTWGLQTSWRPSYRDFGGPGQADPPVLAVAPVLINEVLTHTDAPLLDAIELRNTNAAAVNIGGWFLTDDFATPKKYRIPNGTLIQPNSYIVFDESHFNTPSNAPGAFSFSSKGDEAYLFSGDGTNLTGYLHGYEFGAAENGISFGRHINSQGDVHFVAQSARTLGTNNALPKVGPVVISEISYHPVDGQGGSDNQFDEFIELANISGAQVPLYDPANAANTWRLRSAVDFDFPSGVTLAAGGRVIVVSFNPTNTALLDEFRARWNVGANVSFYGPYDGKLDNSGESVRLYRPDTPEGIEVPYILVDQVDYSHMLPWPAAADGIGPTLQKLTESAYGNDALNWVAVGPSPGGPYVPGGTPPSITMQPNSTAVLAGTPAFFSVTATGTAPLYYQWRYKGANIPGAVFSTFTLPGVQTSQGGPYSVIVYNSAGSIESSNSVLTVLIPASITLQPVNALVRIKPDPLALQNTNATFQALASSSTPLRYQWQRFDGITYTNLDAATNSTLVVTNVQLDSAGDYRSAITDNVGTIFTQPAKLIPLVTPVIVQPPLAQTVPAGGLVSLSVALGVGNPPPFYYEWRRGSLPIGNFTTSSKSNVFTFLAHSNVAIQQYRLIVTNLATTNIQAVAVVFNITTLADNDRDGLPDAFEESIGLNTNNMADASGDLDQDTMSNLAEYLAGTDPTNPASYLRVDHSSVPGTTLLQVAAVSNRTYSVQYKGDLGTTGANTWIKYADIPAQGVNHVETLTVPNAPTNRFWRIAVPATP
jgi:hypothetical protein